MTADVHAALASFLPGYQSKSGSLPDSVLISRLNAFEAKLAQKGFGESYEFSHARLIMESIQTIRERSLLKRDRKLVNLSEASQTAADQLYLDTLIKLWNGLNALLEKNLSSENKQDKQIARFWKELK